MATAVDRERRGVFLEKADVAIPDAALAGLRSASDVQLGIDSDFLRDAMTAFGLAPHARIERAASQGTFHRLYDVAERGREPRLLRVAVLAGEEGVEAMELECRVGEGLRAAGIPVPTAEFRAVSGHGVHLMARVEGENMSALDADEARMVAALGEVARLLARLHRRHGTGFGPLSTASTGDHLVGVHERWSDYLGVRLDSHRRVCEAMGAITTGESLAIENSFSTVAAFPAVPSALLHGDPGNHNFIVDASGIRGVLDWEDALLGDPLFDLASLCTFHPERRHATIWTAYGVPLAPGTAEWTRFWLYFLRIALAKTVHRQRFGYIDRPDRAPAARRIQLALQRLDEGG